MRRYPRLMRVRQRFTSSPIADVFGETIAAFRRSRVLARIEPGHAVAIAVGSRGIANLSTIVRATVTVVKERGASPFIVPAMGSHGGATPEGQRAVLEHYGISEAAMGCPVKASMSTQVVGKSPEGIVGYVAADALSATHIVVVNRVKRHTEFDGAIESGLLKMLCIGLGKHDGARHYHKVGVRLGMEQALRVGARLILSNTPVLCGVVVVEDGYDQTAIIEVLPPEDFERREEQLLVTAKEWAPGLPFDHADVLIVDRIGKDISGSGMDTKVVGRIMSRYSAEPERPRITRIVALDASEGAEGNCLGIGLADFATARLVQKMDRRVTYVNAIAAQTPEKARIPPFYDDDREMLAECFESIGSIEQGREKVIRIRDTLHLEDVWVSEAYAAEVRDRTDLEVLGPLQEMRFDDNTGRLL